MALKRHELFSKILCLSLLVVFASGNPFFKSANCFCFRKMVGFCWKLMHCSIIHSHSNEKKFPRPITEIGLGRIMFISMNVCDNVRVRVRLFSVEIGWLNDCGSLGCFEPATKADHKITTYYKWMSYSKIKSPNISCLSDSNTIYEIFTFTFRASLQYML